MTTNKLLTVKEYAFTRKCNTSYIYQLVREMKQGKKTPAQAGFELVKTKFGNAIKLVR